MVASAEAKLCKTIDLVSEKQKLESLKTFSQQRIQDFFELKQRVKRAQLLSCLDQVLAGQEIAFTESDKQRVQDILNDLEEKTIEKEMLESIEILREELL